MSDRKGRGRVCLGRGGRSPEIKSVSEMLQEHAVNTFSSILSRETEALRYPTQTQIHIRKSRITAKLNQQPFICCKTKKTNILKEISARG